VDPVTQIVDLRREVKTRQRTGLAVAAAVVLVALAGAFMLGTRFIGSDDAAPPAGPSRTADARQVAAKFFAAYDAYDADRMLATLSDEGVATAQWGSPDALRGDAAWRQEARWTERRSPCQASGGKGQVVDLRCDYNVDALGSDQLDRGPYQGSYWSLHVQDGRISYAHAEFPFGTNGFADEMWEPFAAFVESEHPGDADVMYTDASLSEQSTTAGSLRLWKQHVADYVAAETTG